jgi:hypothetical protein
MSTPTNKPLDWIQLELLPLDQTAQREKIILWWNPQTAELLGEDADQILAIVEEHLKTGFIETSLGTIELTEPLRKSTELAALLGQYFWVIPMPVEHAYQLANSPGEDSSHDESVVLQ